MTRRAGGAGGALAVGAMAGAAGLAVLALEILYARDPGGTAPTQALSRPATPDERAAAIRGGAVFRVCAACHSIEQGGPDLDGPNLWGVVGAPVAERRARYAYTQALRDVGGTWTRRRLDTWLKDPAAFAPGTSMLFPGLRSARDRADVIAFLAEHGPASATVLPER